MRGDTNAIHVSFETGNLRSVIPPIPRAVAPTVVGGDEHMCAPAIVGLRLQPRPQLSEIAIRPRQRLKHPFIAAVVRPIVRFIEREVQHAGRATARCAIAKRNVNASNRVPIPGSRHLPLQRVEESHARIGRRQSSTPAFTVQLSLRYTF